MTSLIFNITVFLKQAKISSKFTLKYELTACYTDSDYELANKIINCYFFLSYSF